VARLETYPYFIPGIFSEVGFGFTWGLSSCLRDFCKAFPMLQLVGCGIFCLVMEEKLDGWSSTVCTSSRRGTDPSVVWTTFTCMNFSIN
jgi:hypothetical protein